MAWNPRNLTCLRVIGDNRTSSNHGRGIVIVIVLVIVVNIVDINIVVNIVDIVVINIVVRWSSSSTEHTSAD